MKQCLVFVLVLAANMLLIGCSRTPEPEIPKPPVVVAPKPSQVPVGHEIVSTEGAFKIKFPLPPITKLEKNAEGKPIENYFYQTPDKALIVGFSYMRIPIPADQLNEKTIAGGLDGAAQSFVKGSKGVITKKTEIRLDGFQGLEFHSQTTGATPADSGVSKGRVYWVNGRLIRVLAIGQPTWIATKEVDDFFSSFSLLKQP